MASRKRGRADMEAEEPLKAPSLLTRLRNMWEFANLMQFIMLFGHVFKIDESFEIEDLEDECMRPEPSHKLLEIGMCLLKFLSSARGLTNDDFDEHTRRQYKRRSPDTNPFGDEETPQKFLDFDVFTKLKVLSQLTRWTFLFTDRIRERMPQTKDADQAEWRINEIGWDKEDRVYFILDDNRLYRRTDPTIPSKPNTKPNLKLKPKVKAKMKSKKPEPRKGIRSSKRRKTSEAEEVPVEEENEEEQDNVELQMKIESNNTLDAGFKWECVAVTLQDYVEFLDGIKKSKDPNEKALYKHIYTETLPVLEKIEDDRQKKVVKRQKELLNMEKMAHAKRSSRIADRHEREQHEAEVRAVEEKRRVDLAAARKDAEKQKQMEEARESRMMTREQRLKEREYKRLLHEEELKHLEENSKKLQDGESRLSERHLKAEMAKKQKELEELEEEDWIFDCAKCGVHGENVDDGSHSIACDKCNVWQHSACLGVSQEEAEKEDFHFICTDCRRREEDAKKPKIPSLKFKITTPVSSKVEVRVPNATPTGNQEALSKERKPSETHSMSEALPAKNNSPDAGAIQETYSKKRKSSESDYTASGMPPMKKWKPPSSILQTNGVAANGTKLESSMHQTIMKGPTLTPGGQHNTHRGSNGYKPVPPPGLTSPTRPANQVNGVKSSGPPVGIFSSTMQSLNGHSTPSRSTPVTMPAPLPSVGHTSTSPLARPPSSQQQTPAPSQRSSSSTPSNSFAANSPSQSPAIPHSPSTNLPPSTAASHSLQPGFSPQKPVHSSPAPPAPHSPSLHVSASPTIAPPTSNPQEAGLSPLKNEPPRPVSSHSVSIASLPPLEKMLSPPDQPHGQAREQPPPPS